MSSEKFTSRYHCECGNLYGSFRFTDVCPICNTPVKYDFEGDDIEEGSTLTGKYGDKSVVGSIDGSNPPKQEPMDTMFVEAQFSMFNK